MSAPAASGWATAIFPSGAQFSLELADTPQKRARGYMFRERVAPDEDMLFLFDEDDHHSFWMKNCVVSLDLIWLDAGFRVVEVQADVPPCPAEGDCPSRVPLRAARYVLEVAAGRAAEESLRPGDIVVVDAEPPLP